MERRVTSRNVSLEWIEQTNTDKNSRILSKSIKTTYQRLKLEHEVYLRQNWIEKLESPNQILEQLSLAACLIELWRDMYGIAPYKEQSETTNQMPFPGFVDIACGNGILVYVLHMEGYKGTGIDARRRECWKTFPAEVQLRLEEKVIIPKPFLDVLGSQDVGVEVHSGDFPENTFIISDHADELTVWTPIMAALASPLSPLPFFIIPCCSRSLAGSSYRFPPPKSDAIHMDDVRDFDPRKDSLPMHQNPQPLSGDLRALRAIKMREKTESGFLDSMIGSLAAKTACIAGEVGCRVEKTWLYTPGGINMALIGRQTGRRSLPRSGAANEGHVSACLKRALEVVERECSADGGIQVAAQLWVERVKALRCGDGSQHQIS